MYNKKPVASWVFAFKRVISWEESGRGGDVKCGVLYAFMGRSLHSDDLKRKTSTLVKRDTTILKCLW